MLVSLSMYIRSNKMKRKAKEASGELVEICGIQGTSVRFQVFSFPPAVSISILSKP
jgi:hypothetical protein